MNRILPTRRADAGLALVALLVAIVVTGGCLAAVSSGGDDAGSNTAIEFEDRTDAIGLDYQTDGGGAGNGDDGVYVADYDRDGWQDLLAIGGEQPVLFGNTGGEFERVEGFPEVENPDTVKSALFFDYDGDGWEDLLILRSHGTPVLLHNDEGSFERSGIGLGNLTYPLGATAADYDRDGDLDLLVYQSGDWKTSKPDGYFSLNKTLEEDNGNPNVLYENTGETGEGRFERVADSELSDATRWSLAASFVDLDGDGLPDVHVANDYNTDAVYMNKGNGSFAARTLRGNTSRNGMSSEIADVNGDGAQDVFTTNIYLPLKEVEDGERYQRLELLFGNVLKSGRTKGNTLMINDGTGNLTDEAVPYGVRQGGWGWASSLTDLDNDGDRDLIHATQNVVRIDRDDPHYTLPMLFEREDEGFENRNASEHGLAEHDGRGLVTLDHDRDGDRDVVVAPYDGNLTLYDNVGADAKSIAFRAVDDNGSTAYGAEITVTTPDGSTVIQQTVQSDFLSQESRVSHIGVGGHDEVDLNVRWPDGTEETYEDAATNQQIRITQNGTETVVEYDE